MTAIILAHKERFSRGPAGNRIPSILNDLLGYRKPWLTVLCDELGRRNEIERIIVASNLGGCSCLQEWQSELEGDLGSKVTVCPIDESIGSSEFSGQFILGLVDKFNLSVAPILIWGGDNNLDFRRFSLEKFLGFSARKGSSIVVCDRSRVRNDKSELGLLNIADESNLISEFVDGEQNSVDGKSHFASAIYYLECAHLNVISECVSSIGDEISTGKIMEWLIMEKGVQVFGYEYDGPWPQNLK